MRRSLRGEWGGLDIKPMLFKDYLGLVVPAFVL